MDDSDQGRIYGRKREPSSIGGKIARPARLRSRLKLPVQHNLAGDADLISGDAALEEIRQLLDVLEVHKAEGVLRVVAPRQAEGRETLVGRELEVLPHVQGRKAGD